MYLYYVNVLFKGNSRLSTVYLYPATADIPISLRSPCTQINNSILEYVYIVNIQLSSVYVASSAILISHLMRAAPESAKQT